MRGTEREQVTMFSYVALEARIPADHPLRPVRATVDRADDAVWVPTVCSKNPDRLLADTRHWR